MKTLEQRFWEKVVISEEDECWNWNATKLPTGYGRMSIILRKGMKTPTLS
jgi:hypothetical protein